FLIVLCMRVDQLFAFFLPPLPDFNIARTFPFIPPMTRTTITMFQIGFKRRCEISPAFRTIYVDDDIVSNITDAIREWRFDLLSEFTEDLLATQTYHSGFDIVESAIPPDSFIDALMALTTEQRAHITELALRNDSQTLTRIIDGIIVSLPDEVQPQSVRFTHLLSDLLCYSAVQDQRRSLIAQILGSL
ncbi:hypothetical protein PFISCL1PPCAC_10133, partial [Pristionchus fissidentatus]